MLITNCQTCYLPCLFACSMSKKLNTHTFWKFWLTHGWTDGHQRYIHPTTVGIWKTFNWIYISPETSTVLAHKKSLFFSLDTMKSMTLAWLTIYTWVQTHTVFTFMFFGIFEREKNVGACQAAKRLTWLHGIDCQLGHTAYHLVIKYSSK